jgi:hypothetical protein
MNHAHKIRRSLIVPPTWLRRSKRFAFAMLCSFLFTQTAVSQTDNTSEWQLLKETSAVQVMGLITYCPQKNNSRFLHLKIKNIGSDGVNLSWTVAIQHQGITVYSVTNNQNFYLSAGSERTANCDETENALSVFLADESLDERNVNIELTIHQ